MNNKPPVIKSDSVPTTPALRKPEHNRKSAVRKHSLTWSDLITLPTASHQSRPLSVVLLLTKAMSTIDRKSNSLRKRQAMAKDKAKTKCYCCRRLLTFFFSHIGLGCLVFCYSLIGAFIFRHLEGDFDLSIVHSFIQLIPLPMSARISH